MRYPGDNCMVAAVYGPTPPLWQSEQFTEGRSRAALGMTLQNKIKVKTPP